MNKYKLYTDGSHVVYQNLASFGGYILSPENEELINFSEVIDEEKFKPKHELVGMIYGLEQAIKLGIKNLDCFSDSLSLIDILNTKNETTLARYVLKEPLLSKALDLIDEFDNITLSHVFRQHNKKADKLARKAIIKADVKITQIVKDSFKLNNLYSSNQYLKSNKKIFNAIKEDIAEYLIFTNKFYKNKQYLEIYNAFENKDTKEVKYEKIYDDLLPNSRWKKKVLNVLTEMLNDYNGKSLNLAIVGGFLKDIDFVLRGIVPLSQSYVKEYKELTEVITKMDKLIIHNNINVLNSLDPKKKINILEMNQNNLITAMKVVGREDYELGENLSVEYMLDLPDGKKKNLIEIQKKFFGEFMKISISLDKRFENTNKTIEDKLIEIRRELVEKGVKFRY